MGKLVIYKVTYPNGNVRLYKRIKDFYEDYTNTTDDDRSYDNFRYAITYDLYNTDRVYKHKAKEYNYKMNIKSLEKHDYKTFLNDYLNEYKVIKNVTDSAYSKSTQFYNKLYDMAKYRIELTAAP